MTTHHATIDRLAELSSHELTIADAAFVLGRDRAFIESLIRLAHLEALAISAKSKKRHDGKVSTRARQTYSISAAAVLVYLVKQTSGDKAVLMSAIELRFPQQLPLCLRVAGHALAGTAATTQEPSNVIPMSGRKRAPRSRQPAEHPDQLCLFNFPAQATA